MEATTTSHNQTMQQYIKYECLTSKDNMIERLCEWQCYGENGMRGIKQSIRMERWTGKRRLG